MYMYINMYMYASRRVSRFRIRIIFAARMSLVLVRAAAIFAGFALLAGVLLNRRHGIFAGRSVRYDVELERPLLVLATGGHELDYLGVRQWVAARRAEHGERPVAVIHVGASIAVDEPGDDDSRHLIPTRLAMTDASGESAERIGAALEPGAFIFRPETESWLGESEVFCDLNVPMLSFTGSGVAFHTPEDTTAQVTSAASLALVADAVANAVDALLDGI